MRRSNTGEVRAVPLGIVGATVLPEPGASDTRLAEAPTAGKVPPTITAAHFAILPVSVARDVRAAEHTSFGEQRRAGGLVNAAEPVNVAEVNRSMLRVTPAAVILLDTRHARPSSVYRAVARLRSEGWTRGIVLILEEKDLSVAAVSASIGATDFILPTASARELEERVRRQASMNNGPRREQANDDPVAGIQLHWRTHAVSFEGRTIALTLRELQLLDALMDRGRELITAPDLARLAWGNAKGSGGMTATYVCSLRKKLAWFGGRFGIRTVRGVGYRFVV